MTRDTALLHLEEQHALDYEQHPTTRTSFRYCHKILQKQQRRMASAVLSFSTLLLLVPVYPHHSIIQFFRTSFRRPHQFAVYPSIRKKPQKQCARIHKIKIQES